MRFSASAILCAVVLTIQIPAGAATVTYTFEAPVFSLGQATPLVNKSPNIGDPSFLASFISGPAANGLQIGNNPNLSGLSLFDGNLGPPPDSLTITLNTPVSSVHLDFALFSPGHLDFTSASGNTSASTGTSSQVGVLNFSSPTPFTQFTLAGFSAANAPVLIGIDNLVMNVPEPSTLALIATGAFAALSRRILRRDLR
jgi:hypothetical protein